MSSLTYDWKQSDDQKNGCQTRVTPVHLLGGHGGCVFVFFYYTRVVKDVELMRVVGVHYLLVIL